MKKLLLTMLLAGALGGVSNPAPADAAVIECVDESIASCNGDFSGSSVAATKHIPVMPLPVKPMIPVRVCSPVPDDISSTRES